MLTALVMVLCSAIAQPADWNALMEEAGKLQNQGAYAEAEKKFQDALAEAEKFGPTDRRLGLTLNNLGALSRAQGKYPLAEALSYRALEIWSRTGGPVNTALNNLAVLFVEQGRYAEAAANYRKAISIVERKHGASNPALAPMLTNLGTLSFYQGRYAESEALYRRSLAIEEKAGSNASWTL